MDGETLAIAGARGEVGSTTELFVQLPAGRAAAAVTINGQPAEIASRAPTGVTVRETFDGAMFRQYQPVVEVPDGFAGGKVTGTFTIPRRIVEQLAARRKACRSHGRPRTSAPRGLYRNGSCCSSRSRSRTRAGTHG